MKMVKICRFLSTIDENLVIELPYYNIFSSKLFEVDVLALLFSLRVQFDAFLATFSIGLSPFPNFG